MRMRTCQGVYDAIREADPETSISKNYIRRLILAEAVPVVHCGRRKLVDVDAVMQLLADGYELPKERDPYELDLRRA